MTKAGENVSLLEERMGIFDLHYEDTSSLLLQSVAVTCSGIIAFILAIGAVEEEEEGRYVSATTFAFLILCLTVNPTVGHCSF